MKLILVIATVLALSSAARAEDASTHVTVDWNASMAPFGGLGATVGVKPAAARHLRFGVGALALTLPELGLGENRDMGWTVRDRALLAETRYYLREQRGGFYGGLLALYQQRTFTRDGVASSTTVHQYIAAAQVGYEWFPFAHLGAYVVPNFTFAVRVGETGTPVLGGMTFAESRVLPLPGVILGWQF